MTEDQNPQENDNNQISGVQIREFFYSLIKDFIALDKGVDKWGTIREIKSKQSMSGANAWMLMCSILIASIGLNLNSQAVIIGGMLISPLMSPILGIGLGVAINDKDALRDALLHFMAAIVIALLFATLYFWLIPLDQYTEQIDARTKPTILDILIGVFGGIAGIVSYARKDISTTIPGVAIATALMPPICVTGYGIANGDWDVATKSFYLFFLNSFFVALATYLVLRYLKFPYKEYASKKERMKNIRWVWLISAIVTVPSVLIFLSVINEYRQDENIRNFVSSYIGDDDIFLDSYTMKPQPDGTQTLYLKVYGERINESKIPVYEKALDSMGLRNVSIEIIPTSEIPLEKIKQLETDLSEVGDKLNSQIAQLRDERDARQRMIESMQQDPDFLLYDSLNFIQACEELKIFFPEIEEIGIAPVQFTDFKNGKIKIPTVIMKWNNATDEKKSKIESYMRKHFSLDTLKIVTSN